MKEQRVEELYEHFDVDLYEEARLMVSCRNPSFTHPTDRNSILNGPAHRDRRGIPIYVFVIKHLDSKHVSKYQKDSQKYKDSLPTHKKLDTPAKLLPLFALYHNLLNFILPFVLDSRTSRILRSPSQTLQILSTLLVLD